MPLQRLLSAFPQLAAVILCILGGTGAINALLVNPTVSDPSIDIASFMSQKRKQPVIQTDNRWTLFAGGDVMLSRYVRGVMEREGMDYPYAEINGIVRYADVAFANLENPVGTGTPIPFSGFQFRAEPKTLIGLKNAGFDVFSIGNNHMSDNGQDGIAITTELLKEAGFAFAGAGENEGEARKPALIEVKGQTVAFLSYGESRFSNQVHFAGPRTAGIALANPLHMKEDVAQARRTGADVVIISLHAGTEYRDTPDSYQRSLLDAAASAGADIVLGHHPHVVQPLEQQGKTWIISSLGNLVFDQMWSDAVRRGMMLQFHFDHHIVREIEAIPIQLHKFAQARIATGEPRELALKSLAHPFKDASVIRWLGTNSGAVITPRAMPLQQQALPGFVIHKIIRDNLNGNRRAELYHLKDGSLIIEEDSFPLWESPADWWVQEAFTTDIDGDRSRELILSVWKSEPRRIGGAFRMKEISSVVHNHLMVFRFENGQFQPVWESAALDQPHCEVIAADLNADGKDELAVLEGTYTADASCTATSVAVWMWNKNGFTNAWRSAQGRYWDARTEGAGSGEQLVVNGAAD